MSTEQPEEVSTEGTQPEKSPLTESVSEPQEHSEPLPSKREGKSRSELSSTTKPSTDAILNSPYARSMTRTYATTSGHYKPLSPTKALSYPTPNRDRDLTRTRSVSHDQDGKESNLSTTKRTEASPNSKSKSTPIPTPTLKATSKSVSSPPPAKATTSPKAPTTSPKAPTTSPKAPTTSPKPKASATHPRKEKKEKSGVNQIFSKVIVIAGPSGVGKSTIIKRLQSCVPDTFGFSVSHATRAPRPGEVDGVAYHFVSKDEFEKLVGEGAFVEHAEVHGNNYGTSKAALDTVVKEGKICVLDIDIQGCRQIKEGIASGGIKPVFIRVVISQDELRKRLEGRGTETPESLAIRLGNAAKELEKMPGFFDLEVENDDVDRCARQILLFLEEKSVLAMPSEGGSNADRIK